MKHNLDYTNPDEAVNFRDIGEFINVIAGRTVIPLSRIYRGGTIKAITNPAVIGNPKTIFCLQKGPDHEMDGVKNLHFPISNDYEKYNTEVPEVKTWLRKIISTIEQGIEFPLYIHCLSGRDRTGVVVAALLKICGAEDRHITEEYHLSIGTERRRHIHIALAGFADIENYFSNINLSLVKKALQDPATLQNRG